MAAPRQMTAHSLDAKKGWPSPHAVDYDATFAAGTGANAGLHTTHVAFAGSLVSVNDSGEFEYGCGEIGSLSTQSARMPMWLFQNSDDPDVANDGGTLLTGASGTHGAWSTVAPTGKLMALVAAGSYELATTEFVSNTFIPNDLLCAHANADIGNDDDFRGVMIKTTIGDVHAEDQSDVVGMCSRVEGQNSHGVQELSFWPLYLPLSKLSSKTA